MSGLSAALADAPSLSGEVLKKAVAGTTVHLDTPLGTKLPLSFGADGRVTGTAGPILAAYLGASTDRGRWWVENNKLCHKWLKWFDTDTSCMQIWQEGNRVRWYGDDGRSGTATIVTDTVVAAAPALPTPSALGGPATQPVAAPAAPVTAEAVTAEPVQAASAKPDEAKTAQVKPAAKKRTTTQHRATMATVVPLRQLVPPPAPGQAAPASAAPQASAVTPTPVPPAPVQAVSAEAPSVVPATSQFTASAQPLPPPAAYGAPTYRAAMMQAPERYGRPMSGLAFRVKHVASDDVLNIRNAPSSEAAVVGEIPPHGRGIRMVGTCVAEWCQVRFERVSGWVNKLYLAVDTASADRR